MSRALRKLRLDGTRYFRRDKVEAELQALAEISPDELERRAELWQTNEHGFVSPEALLYFVRNASAGAHRVNGPAVAGRVAARSRARSPF